MKYPPGSIVTTQHSGNFLIVGMALEEASKQARRILYCHDTKSEYFDRTFFTASQQIEATLNETDLTKALSDAKLAQFAHPSGIKLWEHYKGNIYLNFATGVDLVTGKSSIAYHPPRDLNELWLRSFDVFLEKFELEGEEKTRFVPLGGYRVANQ